MKSEELHWDGMDIIPIRSKDDEVPFDPNAETVFEKIRRTLADFAKLPPKKITSYPADQNNTETK